MIRKSSRCALVAGVLLAAGTTASAGLILPEGGVQLDELLDEHDGCFIVDDKEFNILAFDPSGFEESDVMVVPVNFGLNGVGFDLTGTFADDPGDGQPSGFFFSYTVDVLDPDKAIIDVALTFNGLAVGPGSVADVNESIFDPDTAGLIETLNVFASGDLDLEDWQLTEQFDAEPGVSYDSLQVNKDFSLFAPQQGGSATASFIRQTFSQIPAPGAATLAGLVGLAGIRRRR